MSIFDREHGAKRANKGRIVANAVTSPFAAQRESHATHTAITLEHDRTIHHCCDRPTIAGLFAMQTQRARRATTCLYAMRHRSALHVCRNTSTKAAGASAFADMQGIGTRQPMDQIAMACMFAGMPRSHALYDERTPTK